MSDACKTTIEKPSSFCFVELTGKKLDSKTKSTVRSHAMKEVRGRQKRLKKQKREMIVKNICKCEEGGLSQEMAGREIPQLRGFGLYARCRGLGKEGQHMDTIATYGAAEFDPFCSMVKLPGDLTVDKYRGEMMAIQKHVLDSSPGKLKNVIFPEAHRTLLLMVSMLYMSYATLSSVRGWHNPELALRLKCTAISLINKKLSETSTSTCTNVIASIAYLSTGTWIFDSESSETETHMNGMEVMVKDRGMESLGVYMFGQTVRKYLQVQHIVMKAIRVQLPNAAFDINHRTYSTDSILDDDGYGQSLKDAFGGLDKLQNSRQCSKETFQILKCLNSLISLFTLVDEMAMSEEELCNHLFRLNKKIQSASSPSNHPTTDYIFECCRLITTILYQALELSLPLSMSNPALTSALAQALLKTDLGFNWNDMTVVLYWVSMIGSATGQGRPGHKILDATLGRAMFEMCFSGRGYECAVRPARLFSRLQIVLERRGVAGGLWNEA